MMAKESRKRVEYFAPEHDTLFQFTKGACGKLADDYDPTFADPEFIRGMVEFFRVAGVIQAKHLNGRERVDNNDR